MNQEQRRPLGLAIGFLLLSTGCNLNLQATTKVVPAAAAEKASKPAAKAPSPKLDAEATSTKAPAAPGTAPADGLAKSPDAAGKGDVALAPPPASQTSRRAELPRRLVPKVPDSLVKLLGASGAALVGNDGSTLIGNDGSTLIGNDGSTLIGNDGSTLIGNDGSTMVNKAGSYTLAQVACPTPEAPSTDAIGLMAAELRRVAEVVQAAEPLGVLAKAAAIGIAITTDFQALGAAMPPGTPAATTVFAEFRAGGGAALFQYDAKELDPKRISLALVADTPRKGTFFVRSKQEQRPGDDIVCLTFDQDTQISVMDLYQDITNDQRTRVRVEMAKLPTPAADGAVYVVRAASAMAPRASTCDPARYSLTARFDAAGRAAIRLGAISPGETKMRFQRADGTLGDAADAEAGIYLSAEGKPLAGDPPPALRGMLAAEGDLLPIPDLNSADNPADEAALKPPVPETTPTDRRTNNFTFEDMLKMMPPGGPLP